MYTEGMTYKDAHQRMTRTSPASTHWCPCGTRAQEWAYQGGCPDERVEERNGARYSFDSSRYRAMCRACHRATDGRERRMPMDIEAAAELYAQGLTVAEVAARLEVNSVQQLRRRLREAGVSLRRGGTARVVVDVEALVAAYSTGASVRAAAEAVGVTASVARDRLDEAGALRRRARVDDAAIAAAYLAGGPAAVDVPSTTLYRALRSRGVETIRGPQVRPVLDGGEVERRYLAGATSHEIAAEDGSSAATVLKLLRARGVAIRPRGRSSPGPEATR